jgi:YesN/AraC family two-component response regulator
MMPHSIQPLRILIADDKKAIRTGLSHLVKEISSSLEVLEAANGLEAWDLVRDQPYPKLAFVDIRMPGLDGLQLCEKIHTESLPVKVAIVSAFREFDYARQALRFGVSEYLLKPVNADDVLRLVNGVLSAFPEAAEREHWDEKQAYLVIERVRKHIHDHLHQEFTLGELAEKLHYSPNYLSMLFKKQIGKGFLEYLTECRMQRALLLLQDPALRISAISEQVGYANPRAFSLAFRKVYHMAPKEYRDRQGIFSVE